MAESYTLYASRAQLIVGPYSGYGWHHPGPLYFYLLAPWYVLSGNMTSGLSSGALAINLVSMIISAWVLTRMNAGGLALTMTGLSALYVWRVAPLLVSPWNPHVVVLPTMTTVVVGSAVMGGSSAMLPLGVLTASFAAQTHLGVFPTVFAVLAVALSVVLKSAVLGCEPDVRRHALRSLVAALGMVVVLWAIPFWEEATRTPGNLTELWRFFSSNDHAGQRFRTAYATWADVLAGIVRPHLELPAGSRFRRSRIGWVDEWSVAQVALLAITSWLYARGHQRLRSSVTGLLALTSLLALWSTTRLEAVIEDHKVFWISGLGVLNTAALVDAAASAAWRQRKLVAPRVASVACGGILVGVFVLGLNELHRLGERTDVRSEPRAAATLAHSLERWIRATGAKPFIEVDHDAWPVAAGVLLHLQKQGLTFAVADDWLPMFTESVAANGGETGVIVIAGSNTRLVLTSEARAVTLADAEPYYLLIASSRTGTR